jgi:hypothetical protein
MATTVSLVKVFAASASYVADHESNYTKIEAAINSLYSSVQGTASSVGADVRLNEIYDRNGIIGKASYKPVAATLSPSPYNMTVAAGSYWSGSEYRTSLQTTIALLSFSTATLYLNVPTGGIPTVTTSATADTAWQFSWDASTHVVSSVIFYSSTCDILFDGDDYNAAISGYDSLDARLDAIAAASTFLPGQYAERSAAHSGLNFGYYGGLVHNDNVVTSTSDGTVALTNATTNYVEVNVSTGAVTANTSGFTSGRIPLFTVVTSGGAISTVTDKRTWARGGGTGSHAQNTDIGTDSADFKLLRTVTGTPSSNGSFTIERGTSPDVSLRWNETTDKWQYTNDGTTFNDMGSGSGIDLGAQGLTKYKALDDPILILEQLAGSTDGAYVQKNLGPSGDGYISDAPQGVAALVLRVAFWDSAPGSTINIKFKQYGAVSSPTKSYTVWGGTSEHSGYLSTLVIPGDNGNTSSPTIGYEYLKTASGSGTCNVRVWLMGYYIRVTGVGTQTKAFSSASNVAAANTSTSFNKTSFVNRGLVYLLKLTETGGTSTGTYDVNIYAKDTFLAADLLYSATGISSTANSRIYTDRLPFMYLDSDNTSELHIKITNNDATNNMTFTFALTCEQFL